MRACGIGSSPLRIHIGFVSSLESSHAKQLKIANGYQARTKVPSQLVRRCSYACTVTGVHKLNNGARRGQSRRQRSHQTAEQPPLRGGAIRKIVGSVHKVLPSTVTVVTVGTVVTVVTVVMAASRPVSWLAWETPSKCGAWQRWTTVDAASPTFHFPALSGPFFTPSSRLRGSWMTGCYRTEKPRVATCNGRGSLRGPAYTPPTLLGGRRPAASYRVPLPYQVPRGNHS